MKIKKLGSKQLLFENSACVQTIIHIYLYMRSIYYFKN